MWGFEPANKDMSLTKGADFIQTVEIRNPDTQEPFELPEGSRVFFRVGDSEWDGTIDGHLVSFKIESAITDRIRRGAVVQFCYSVPTGDQESDWVLTTGRVIRD